MTTLETSFVPDARGPGRHLVRNGEIDLAVFEEGEPGGETIILVHGWPDTHHLWRGVVPLLRERFRVVSYDLRGFGESSCPKRTMDFRISELAEDFRAVADAVSPDRPVHVLAHDWGSSAVWDVVCEPGAEDRIASFTSVSGPNAEHLSRWVRDRLSRPTPRDVLQPLNQLLHLSYMLFFATPLLPKVAFSLGASAAVWRRFLARQDGIPADKVSLADTFEKDIVQGLGIYRANAIRSLGEPRDRRTKVPVQLIVGTRDIAVRPQVYDDTARWTERLWRRDIRAGHWSPFSHPQVLAEATTELIDALAGNEPARALRRAAQGDVVGRKDGRPFADQLVVITGAGSGIGRETALAFAREGAEVVVSDIGVESAKDTAALIAATGGTAHAYQLDVADEEAVATFAQHVFDAHGVPDVLVNNAGIGHAGRFLDTPSAEFRRVMDINFNGVVFGCRAFAGQMVGRGAGGHIVNLASMAAYTPQQGMGPYASSKAAVFMFSDCLRAELAPAGIGVTTVCPGVVHTNIVATTTFSGVSAEEQSRKQANGDRLYRMRRYTPGKVAKQIVKAVKKNTAVLPVTPEARGGYYLSRFVPALSRRMARSSLVDRL